MNEAFRKFHLLLMDAWQTHLIHDQFWHFVCKNAKGTFQGMVLVSDKDGAKNSELRKESDEAFLELMKGWNELVETRNNELGEID